jgi:hypothetical protein
MDRFGVAVEMRSNVLLGPALGVELMGLLATSLPSLVCDSRRELR